jgi:hypothetical protein
MACRELFFEAVGIVAPGDKGSRQGREGHDQGERLGHGPYRLPLTADSTGRATSLRAWPTGDQAGQQPLNSTPIKTISLGLTELGRGLCPVEAALSDLLAKMTMIV